MSESTKAVFLSYASQDVEAAKRIADALRGAGVEVWFDAEGGLEHGDEWDAKIRRQIKDCVLFIPVISANTQAREEGYFRIEWELAAQRALGIASGVAFILPVVIDATREPEALVPDRFRSVQWTRLSGGHLPPEVLARFLKLWSHRTGVLKQAALEHVEPGRTPAGPRDGRTAPSPGRRSVFAGVAVLVLGAILYVALKPRRTPEEIAKIVGEAQKLAAAVTPPASAAPPVSEARQLTVKARTLLQGLDATREDFALADEYCQRALKLDPDDGEAWAAASQVNSAFVYRGWDASPARKEQTRLTAERAIRLAPTSTNARLAQAGAWSSFNINREEREKLLREILRDEPDNQEVLRFLAVTVLAKPGGLEDCLALNERSNALPGGDPLALFNNARYLWTRGRPAEAYATLQRALAQKSFISGLVLKMAMETNWLTDLVAAEATLQQIPTSALQEDRASYSAGLVRYYQRNADAALEIWQAFPRDYYVDFVFEGPKGLLLGLADELDHRDAAAKIEWRAALQGVEKRIAAMPNNALAHYNRAYLLACLGEKAAAGEALRTYEQLAGIKFAAAGQPMPVTLARVYARLGRFDEIFAHPPAALPVLKISPEFETLRADPRFAQLVEAAGPATERVEAGPAIESKADQKSIAVLAFANLSDDKANEYFSDGISEELLNVLAKVPGLKVSARTSAFYFKGKEVPVPEIAKQLGVAYVIEGSVRKAGDKVRITAQLIKAADGFHVWSDTFTRDLKDVFAVQDEIAGLIAQNLQLKIGLKTAREVKPEAAQLYLQGRYELNQFTQESARRSIELLQQAVKIDPGFAPAWAAMSRAASVLGGYGDTAETTRQGYDLARHAARRAIELDPELPVAYLALAEVQGGYDYDWAGTVASLRRAQALAPEDAAVLQTAARQEYGAGRPARAAELAARAVAADPVNPVMRVDYGFSLLSLKRFEEARVQFRKIAEMSPAAPWGHAGISLCHALEGDFERAAQEASLEKNDWSRYLAQGIAEWGAGRPAAADAAVTKLKAFADVAAFQIGEIHAFRKDKDQAFEWLERAYRQHDPGLGWIRSDPLMANLRGDPRYDALLRKLRLADDQLP